MILEIQLTTNAWRARLNFKLTWDQGHFEMRVVGPFCRIVVRICSDQAELPFSLP